MHSLLFLVAFAVFLQDSAETSTVDPTLSPGIGTDFVECTLKNQASISDLTNMMEKVCSKFTGISGELLLEPCISQEEWRDQVQYITKSGWICKETVTNLKQTQPQVAESAVWLEATGGLRKGVTFQDLGRQLEEQNQVMQQQQQDMHEENRRIHDIVQKMEATLANFSENLGSLDQDPNKNSSNDDTLTPSTSDDDTLSPLVKIR
nr:uncharacterized protein LOC109151056 isoform X4 [Ipomoea trifida]